MYYLYKITNNINQKIYIGQSIEPNRRWTKHKSYARNNNAKQYIDRAMSKYGIENFIFEIIAISKNIEDANISEDLLIIQYDSRNLKKGYNIAPGGSAIKGENNPFYGKNHSKETKEKISKSNKGKIPWNKNLKFEGKLHISETKQKIAKKLIGNKNGIGNKGNLGRHWKKIDGKRIWF